MKDHPSSEPDMFWCSACRSYHVDPTSKEHHAALQCKAPYKSALVEHLLAQAEANVAKLKAEGWTQQDFAKELSKMLGGP